MADQRHVDLVRQGADATNKWRERKSNLALDLSGADFSNTDLSHINLAGCNLDHSDFSSCTLKNAIFSRATLRSAIFTSVNAFSSDFSSCNLQDADFSYSNCTKAGFASTCIAGTNFTEAILSDSELSNCYSDVSSQGLDNENPAIFTKANLSHSRFPSAKISNSKLDFAVASHCNFGSCDLAGSDLTHANLQFASFDGTKAMNCNLAFSDFKECRVHGADFSHAQNAAYAKNLDTVYVGTEFDMDAKYFNTCIRDWIDTYLDWEQIRTVGRLHLFGASYAVLILIPLFFYAMSIYNDKVQLFVEWSNSNTDSADSHVASAATIIANKLTPLEIPSHSLLLLVATVFLAIGATIYTFGCPARVKEFSKDQWCDQLGRSLIHYWPLSWRNRRLRLACAVCYFVGGTGVACVLATKIWTVFIFILKNM